eukprot:8929669-Pyramimonas_sp.AAC.1
MVAAPATFGSMSKTNVLHERMPSAHRPRHGRAPRERERASTAAVIEKPFNLSLASSSPRGLTDRGQCMPGSVRPCKILQQPARSRAPNP